MKIKCQRCSERATLHITEIEDDGYREVHLCHKCAQKYLQEAEEAANVPAFAGALIAASENSKSKCPHCNLTFGDFRSTGRLGCAQDYDVFREELKPLLENIHGALKHVGKKPRRLPRDASAQSRMDELRQKLHKAVAVEDYELAAQMRDEINALEKDR